MSIQLHARAVAAMLPQTAHSANGAGNPTRRRTVTGNARRQARPRDQQQAGGGPNPGSSVGSMHTHRRSRKIRRTGRHTTPSQVEKVAEKAGRYAGSSATDGACAWNPQNSRG